MGIPDYPKIVKRPMDMDQKLGGKDAKEGRVPGVQVPSRVQGRQGIFDSTAVQPGR